MAKNSVPNTNVRGGVRSTMDGMPMKGSANAGVGAIGRMAAPFDEPRAMGNGDIDVKIYESLPTKPATTVNAGMVSPPIGGTQAVGQRRFKQKSGQ